MINRVDLRSGRCLLRGERYFEEKADEEDPADGAVFFAGAGFQVLLVLFADAVFFAGWRAPEGAAGAPAARTARKSADTTRRTLGGTDTENGRRKRNMGKNARRAWRGGGLRRILPQRPSSAQIARMHDAIAMPA